MPPNNSSIAFKVSRQSPSSAATPSTTVLNCRVSRARPRKRPSKPVPQPHEGSFFTSINNNDPNLSSPSPLKRKRDQTEEDGFDQASTTKSPKASPTDSPRSTTPSLPYITTYRSSSKKAGKPTKLRVDRPLKLELPSDIWFQILSFSHPEVLLKLRQTSAQFTRMMASWPKVWEESRERSYGDSIPPPVSGLTEFQYATLRHGHGCQSCGAPNTRKTYWVFLRRWCKACLDQKTVNDEGAKSLLKDTLKRDVHRLRNYVPSGVVDSWGNIVGAGPAYYPHSRSLYLKKDLETLLHDYNSDLALTLGPQDPNWAEKVEKWLDHRLQPLLERKQFADKLRIWEDMARHTKKVVYDSAKLARRAYFIEKAAEMAPPVSKEVLERCPSYKKSVAIPKDPNMTSWMQLKPKIEAERWKAQEEAEAEAAKVVRRESAPPALVHAPMAGHQPHLTFLDLHHILCG